MLKKIRTFLAIVMFLAITLLFLDFTGTIHSWLGWTAKIQFLPAILALNIGVVIALVVLTLLLGRVYCSIICPMGVMQDIISWFRSRSKKGKYRFTYSPALKWLRYGILVLFIVALVAGIGSLVALLAPYSSYGRIVQNLFSPVYLWINNLLAYFAERADSYTFYEKEIWIRSIPTFVIAAVTFVVIGVLAWRSGRTYCNTICPVGTVLGALSKFSWFRPVINTDKCNNCGLCARQCKSSCIDAKNHVIDYSRCVACMDCIAECKHSAITYSHLRTKGAAVAEAVPDEGRRSLMVAGAIMAGSAALNAEKTVDGGLAVIPDKKIPNRATKILPPGSASIRHFEQHCTACQLCVSACPNGVLRPSSDLKTLMQPESSYEIGYCRPECTRCGDVCPAGAIKPITREEKSSTKIGRAVWVKKNCIPLTDDVECGNCARHCPVGAIAMVPADPADEESRKIPAVNEEKCIGCGACENLCPARPFSAIYVEGIENHRII